jgi:hypothetical protein
MGVRRSWLLTVLAVRLAQPDQMAGVSFRVAAESP